MPIPTGEAEPARFILEAIDIDKYFGELKANDHVTLRVEPGEIHALLGENGAGKSTLVKIIYGALQPSAGEIRWRGQPVTISNPAAARKLGIGMVFQHFSLFEPLTVAENIALAMSGDFNLRTLSDTIARVSREYGLPLNPGATVADLSVGERQRIEIIRCLLQQPKLLIMDEPTAVLTPQEAEQLFTTLRRLAKEGCAILYISHRLQEVKELCHRATILRHGKVVAEADPRQETAASLARMMVGADIKIVKPQARRSGGAVKLLLNRLAQPADGPFGVALKKISLTLHSGELVAIAGVAGNGQSELFDALSGERTNARSDAIIIDGVKAGRLDVAARRKLGAAFVPEERLGHGAVPAFLLSENVVLTRHNADPDLIRQGLLNRPAAIAVSERVAKEFDVRKAKPDPEARSLSGGNLQKFVVGREMDRRPKILIVNQPTWGVDAGASALIRQALIDLARSGSAVLVISQDLDEIFEIADRISVISRGELSDAYPADELTYETVGLLMGGAHEKPEAEDRRHAALV
jgi:general nucleoside transport system ATP-binding protein